MNRRLPTLGRRQRRARSARAGRSLDGFPLNSRANLILSDDAAAAREPMCGWIATSRWYSYPKWAYRFNDSPECEERLQPFKDFLDKFGRKPRNVDDCKLGAHCQQRHAGTGS